MKKRLLSFALACMMVGAMMLPSFGKSTKISALCRLPTISVSLSPPKNVVINPSKSVITLDGKVSEEGQIINTPRSILNLSEVPIQVNVTAAATIRGGSKMTLAKESVTGETGKKVFLYLQSQTANPDDDVENLYWPGYDDKTDIVVQTTTSKLKSNMLQLAAAKDKKAGSAGGLGVFHLGGDVVSNPEPAWNPSQDSMTVTVTFTFTAVSNFDD